jgi:S-adenosylmethionine synthetase
MKLFIAGASGIVGRDLATLCDREGVQWVGSYQSRPFQGGMKVNFLDYNNIKKALVESGPTHLVNCIVERFTDVCEKDWNKTVLANVQIPELIARVCKELGIHLIHISTDYVFDGREPPFYPESHPNPLQNYGISKLLAELRIQSVMGSVAHTILRVPVLYTDSYKTLEETAVTVIAKKVMNQIEATTKEDNVSVRRPVYIPDFCEYILWSVKNGVYGVRHFYNSVNKTTKYEMAKLIGKALRLPTEHIQPIDSFGDGAANRPIDTQMLESPVNYNYEGLSIQEGIQRCFKDYSFPKLVDEPSKFLLLFDLDGTLVDTETLHYESYRDVLLNWGIELKRKEFDFAVNSWSIEQMLKGLGIQSSEEILAIRSQKTAMLSSSSAPINLVKGAKELLELGARLGIEMAVVTNTNLDVVESFKRKCPELGLIKNWITRSDYEKAKPHSDGFEMAVKLFGGKKEHIIVFENTINGAKAGFGVTRKVFCITNKEDFGYPLLKDLDCVLIPNFEVFLKAHC